MAKSDESKKEREMVYIIAGKDNSLVNRECEQLLEKLLEPQQRAVGLFNVDPAGVSISEVLDELRTAPFLSDKRVVLVRGADDFVSKNRQLLEKYFDNPCSTGQLILTVTSWPVRTKLAKMLPRVGKLISVAQPKRWQLPERLIRYAVDVHSKNIAKDAVELLIELVGDNLGQLYGEIDKLALFAEGEKAITAGHIESLVGQGRLFNCFAVIDACLAGNIARAIARLRNMFAEDRTAEHTVVGAFAFHFRRMFNAKVLLGKGLNPGEVAGRLKIWGNKDLLFAQLRKISLKQIGANLQRLAATDYAIKTGRVKARVAAEQLVLELAAGQ